MLGTERECNSLTSLDVIALSATTNVFPFFANKEYYLITTVYSEHDIASLKACNFATDPDKLQSTLKAEIIAAQ